MKKAYFAGGCFWCITPVFYDLEGVTNVISGYSGGDEVNPTYEQVKHQETSHREAICVEYEESTCNYETILNLFLANVDPYDGGGQFIDRGRSYTLAIFYTSEAERLAAQAALKALEQEDKTPQIALEPFKSFYDAEEYHQNFFRTHPEEFARELVESGRK